MSETVSIDLSDKEYILQQKIHYGHTLYRCISWYPHRISTDWYNTKSQAIEKADMIIERFYQKESES